MELRLLRTFCAVVEHGSIGAAAERLGYTQSAASRQVADLEASVGARLFDRVARGVEMTEHGRRLLPHARAVLARVSDARAELDAVTRLEVGRLRVGAFPTAVAALVPRALASLRTAHPNVEVSLVEGVTRRLLARLDGGEADVAVISAVGDEKFDEHRFALTPLLEDAMLVALPESHRLARRRRIRVDQLSGERWIGAASDDDCALLGVPPSPDEQRPPVDLVVREWTAKLGVVAAGLGVTVVPALAAPAVRGDVALVPLDRRDAPPRRIYAATLRTTASTPAAGAFLAGLRSAADAMSG